MKKSKNKNQVKNGKKVIDLTSYINPNDVQYDTNGSYTGMTNDTFYGGELENPVQDADDL